MGIFAVEFKNLKLVTLLVITLSLSMAVGLAWLRSP
jgi:hypothetical protein